MLEVTWTAKSELYLPGNIASAYSLRICVIFPACFCDTQNTEMLFLMDQVPSISLFQWVIWVGIGALISQGTLQIAKRNEQR